MSSNYTYVSLFKNPIPLDESGQNFAVVSTVVIPRIQRPYAQGRLISESELVRKNFLKELFAVLRGDAEDMDLNFVYGRLENRKRDGQDYYIMQLLDGQQRLTTLFLLHWYLYNREMLNDQNYVRALKSFSYETRETSTEFCKMLGLQVERDQLLRFYKDGSRQSPREVLRSSLYYVHAFDQDPTVSAMLTMLDAIDEMYNESCPIEEHKEYWKRLGRICFAVLSLTQYKLSEELYIKMNARGLPLSPFDCFKADFLSLMDLPNVKKRTHRLVHLKTGLDAEVNDEDAVTFKQFFGTKLDCLWCDLFWRRNDPSNYDSSYMLFFSRYFAARYLIEHQHDVQSKAWRKDVGVLFFHKRHEDDRVHYHGIALFRIMVEKYGGNIDYFDDITNLLNLLKSRKSELLEAMKPLWQTVDCAQLDYFCDGALHLELRSLVVLSSVIAFVHEFPSCPIDIFRVWMKIVNNVVENTDIADYSPVASTTGKLAQVIRLVAATKPTNEFGFYRAMATITKGEIGSAAIAEEIEKACRISNDEENVTPQEWISLFDNIAKHPFFRGMIGFYYSATMSFPVFRDHFKLIGSLFGEDGIAEAYRGKRHYLLRAIFAQIQKWKQLDKRYVVEGNTERYLKNLISSLNDTELRERMHDLFAVQLLGKALTVTGVPSPEVERALCEAISRTSLEIKDENWSTREALSVLRDDERFYAWVFKQEGLVHVYEYWGQIFARAPRKWSCVMMPIYRYAEEIAKSLIMEKVESADGRNGYSGEYGMYIGQDFQMRKALVNHNGAYVYVRFYAGYNGSYPIEITIRWHQELLTQAQSDELREKFKGEAVGISGDERYIRINTWTFSATGGGPKTIDVKGIEACVNAILTK